MSCLKLYLYHVRFMAFLWLDGPSGPWPPHYRHTQTWITRGYSTSLSPASSLAFISLATKSDGAKFKYFQLHWLLAG